MSCGNVLCQPVIKLFFEKASFW